jgi:hypothetical protein
MIRFPSYLAFEILIWDLYVDSSYLAAVELYIYRVMIILVDLQLVAVNALCLLLL